MNRNPFKQPTRRKNTRIKSKVFIDIVKDREGRQRSKKGHLREIKRFEKAMKGLANES